MGLVPFDLHIHDLDWLIYTFGAPKDINEVVSDDTCINLPATDAYFDEIKYFTECILQDKPTDKIKPEELEYVLDILKQY